MVHGFKICVVILFVYILSIKNLACPAPPPPTTTPGPNLESCKTPTGEKGRCVNIYSCKQMMFVFDNSKQPISQKVVDQLKEYRCGFEDGKPKVCCPLEYIYLDEQDTLPVDVSKHENIGLVNQDCGKRTLFAYPWTALFFYKTNNGTDFECVGSILNDRYILTSASCIRGNSSLLGVRVGERNLSTEVDCVTTKRNKTVCTTHQDLRIKQIFSYHQFRKLSYQNNIGLLKVEKMNLTENVQPICLPIGNVTADSLTRRFLTLTGLGIVLSKVSLPFIPLAQCRKVYKQLLPITRNQICAGGLHKKDPCTGDGGGPLQHLTWMGTSRRYVQYGIVSFGGTVCGEGVWPNVFTKVEKYLNWILDKMEPELDIDVDVR